MEIMRTLIGPLEEADNHKLDMAQIASLVRDAGIPCIVCQTGGGTATLFAGEANLAMAEDEPGFYPVSAGPGSFYPHPTADDREFSCGFSSEFSESTDCEGMPETAIAAEIIRYVRLAPQR
jgi:hypothetical protein